MSVVNKIIGGVMLAGSLLSTGCSERMTDTNTIDKQVKIVMADQPYTDYEQATAHWRPSRVGVADAQSTLDSIGYRKAFETTQAAKDSVLVAEFNKIAANNRVPQSVTSPDKIFDAQRLIAQKNYSTGVVDAIDNSYRGGTVSTAQRQHILDSAGYNGFFKKHNLINDTTRRALDTAEKLTKPIPKIIGRCVYVTFPK